MLNDSNYNPACALFGGEQIVAYIYDEATEREKIEFELHLTNCRACGDEISEFASMRSSFAEMREDLLARQIPIVEISALGQSSSAQKSLLLNAEQSIFSRLSNIFSAVPIWKTATAGSAALAVIFIGIYAAIFLLSESHNLVVDQSRKFEISSVKSEEQFPLAVESNSPTLLAEEKSLESNINKSSSSARNTKSEKTKSAENLIAASSGKAPKSKTISSKSKNAITARTEVSAKNEINAKRRQMPKLSDLHEQEDDIKSLRLADLFDEIGSD